MTRRIELTEPIKAYGEERGFVELREPNGGDVAACGYPFRIIASGDGGEGGGQILLETQPITSLISRLGNIPRGSVAQMNVADWNSCMMVVVSFFGDADQTLSSAVSTSPLSGNGALTEPLN